MLAEELKSKISRIWNTLWSGGLTNPIKDVEQITYLIFMKLLDEQQTAREAKASLLGIKLDKPIFGKGVCVIDPVTNLRAPYADLRWQNFCHKAPDEMFHIVKDYVFPFIKTLGRGKDSNYGKYMETATFEIPNARTLLSIVSEISSMDLSDMDTMGDIYEELINTVKTSGTNGQFRTPRNIIDMIVALVRPTLDDTIVDPAMGTAGFLLSAAKYLSKNYRKELTRTANAQRFKNEIFNGNDTDPSMLRIGAMNLLLHGIEEPRLSGDNSIEPNTLARGEYSLIVANPPFAGNITNITIADDLTAIAKTTKTELLFVSLFTRLLKVGGRCASIVPQGVLFGGSKAHVNVRKELIEHQRLLAVISMPSGVFQPYSGVATAVLVFQKTDSGGTDRVWFYDMKAVGYSLDQKTEPIDENDIPDVIARYHAREKESPTDRKSNCFFVSKAELAENNYDLSFNKYRETEVVKENFPPTAEILDEIDALTKDFAAGMKSLKGML